MAAITAKSDAVAATQKQLLALVQHKGNAETALGLLVQSGVADELASPSSELEKATALLRLGVAVAQSPRARAGAKPSTAKLRDAKKSKEGEKQWALVAAKVAQSVIKLYVGGASTTAATAAAADGAVDDVAYALDLATLALSVSCQFESLVKLGDFVVENMLYQVAKKLGEMPQCTVRALWIFAALHVRLWHQHSSTCGALNQKSLSSETSPMMKRIDEWLTKRKKTLLVLDDLVDLCTFPAPQSFHTLQFTRFLISLVNAAVNMLLAANNHQAILEVCRKLEPWIAHLSRIPGVDAKLPASFSDRLFRVLWKCAAAVDIQKPAKTEMAQDESLEYRSLALSFLLKCPNYSNGYFIQQVHRVGAQFEKKTNSATDNSAAGLLQKFYTDSANALLVQRIQQGKGFKEATIDWDYINWLEHFSSVCDLQLDGARNHVRVDALTVLHHATSHLSSTDPVCQVAKGCFLAVAGSIVVEQRHSNGSSAISITENEVRRSLAGDVFHSTVLPKDQDLIVAATVFNNDKPRDTRWLKALRCYMEGIHLSRQAAQAAGLGLPETHLGLVLRLVRKAATRLFTASSSGVESSDFPVDLVLLSIVALGDLLSCIRKNDGVQLSDTLEDSFLSLEGRIRRFSLSISAKLCMASSREEASMRIETFSKDLLQFQNVLDHAMSDSGKQRSSMPSLLSDLQAIAREAYMCATYFYKKQHHELVELSLEASFALAENYLEQVMCHPRSAKNPIQVEAAHGNLKVDALASLLAFSCRQQGKLMRSRKYHGHAILYSSDPSGVVKTGAIDKYVTTILDEYESLSSRDDDEVFVGAVCSLCESIAAAWAARGVDKETITSIIRQIGDSFARFSSRSLNQLRLMTDITKEPEDPELAPQKKIVFSSKLDVRVWKILWTRDGCLPQSLLAAMESVVRAINKRKAAFCEYYVTRDDSLALSGLLEAQDELTRAIEQLSTSKDPVTIDVGGCYGWRGVLALEICQMNGYASRSQGSALPITCTQEKALEDIRHCLACWREVANEVSARTRVHVFDARGVACCLDAVSHALSLMSQFQLESEARAILSSMQASSRDESSTIDYGIGISSMILQPAHALPDSACVNKLRQQSLPEGRSTVLLLLGVVDADIGLCIASAVGGDLVQARLHLSSAAAGIDELRSTTKVSSEDMHLYSAVAMRELALSMAESEVVFHEGNITQAIRDAKSALSICWKVSKKVGVAEPDRERYGLPEVVKAALGKHADQTQQSSQLALFQAIECWSWDILLAAKLILSRVAYLYALSNQPFRSSVYYAEAMALVSGIVPTATRNRPFFEFAQLQLLAERTSHAMAVHQLVTLSSEGDADSTDDNPIDSSVLLQNCEVQLQRGDLYLLEGKEDESRKCYEQSLCLVEQVDQRTPAVSIIRCGGYRRILKLLLRTTGTPWLDEAVDLVLDTLRKLKKAIKKCPDLIEHAMSTCQLVQTSLALLRSSSSKAFLPLEKLATLMQDVLNRCDHLRIAYVSHEIRLAMGLVYLMQSESGECGGDETMEGSTSWAAAAYLSNYHVIENLSEDTSSIESAASCSSASWLSSLGTRIQKSLPRTWLIASITVGELSDFTLSLTPTNGRQPQSFWLGTIKWDEYSQHLGCIIEASRKTLFGDSANGAEDWTSDKKKQWWNTRKELDERLQALITKAQEALGFWRALLTFTPTAAGFGSSKSFADEFAAKVHKGARSLTERSKWLVSAVSAAKDALSDGELFQCIDHVAIEENVSIRQEVAQQLVRLIRERGGVDPSTQATTTILVLHHRLEKFPWEGIDVLRDRSVTRMPSLELILQNAKKRIGQATQKSVCDVTACATPTSVSFLLNPAGDLKSTQHNLEPIFRRGESEFAWRGIVGEVPDDEWMRDALLQSSLFVFCGHGSGEKYFHRDKIAGLQGKGCASALLFGCSSGRLEREGVFGPNGAVVSYLQAGSPAVLAMLWDVTDRDVDLMSKDILENWLLADRKEDAQAHGELLSVALQRSRRLCKLRYLNGLAAVCYGLPLGVTSFTASPSESSGTKRRKIR